MKRATETQVTATCAEYAAACLRELYNADPEKPVMALKVGHLDVTGYREYTVDFVKDVNENRLKEYDWIVFFKGLMNTAPETTAAVTSRYRPSDAEVTWAAKIVRAITSEKMDKMRALLDKGPPGQATGFNVTVPLQMAQSIPEYEDSDSGKSASPQKPRPIRGELSVNAEYGTVDILLEPFSRENEIERLGYKRLIHATIYWFVSRNFDVIQTQQLSSQEQATLAAAAASDERQPPKLSYPDSSDISASLQSLSISRATETAK